jgi:hypothetical protein
MKKTCVGALKHLKGGAHEWDQKLKRLVFVLVVR